LTLRAALASICLLGVGIPTQALSAEGGCNPTPENNFCADRRIVAGNLVDVPQQRALGLVALSNDCSGTLLNRFWVLTTDHCVGGGVFGGPPVSFTITAAWSNASVPVTPTNRFVRFWNTDRLDVALIYLGNGDFGPVDVQHLFVGPVNNGSLVTKYGRGISAYAYSDSMGPHPATRDGLYRSAQFTVSPPVLIPTNYMNRVNSAGQVGNAGDSGGADFALQGSGLAITGVQSRCHFTACLAGKNCSPVGGPDWNWVTKIDYCESAPIDKIRDRILQAVQVPLTPVYYLYLSQ
jgi:hypothetical protein